MASGAQDLETEHFIVVDQDHRKLGNMTWAMNDRVAAAFKGLPIEVQRAREDQLQLMMSSMLEILTFATIKPDPAVDAEINRCLDMLTTQAHSALIRIDIMER